MASPISERASPPTTHTVQGSEASPGIHSSRWRRNGMGRLGHPHWGESPGRSHFIASLCRLLVGFSLESLVPGYSCMFDPVDHLNETNPVFEESSKTTQTVFTYKGRKKTLSTFYSSSRKPTSTYFFQKLKMSLIISMGPKCFIDINHMSILQGGAHFST